ncbi:MAG: universal stress protein [Nitrospira sp.]|jgi:nucleotide-binding universal stress UspA family protein|nr:universal stress protein [Nitrospira sp.]
MTTPQASAATLPFQRILHPSDFSEDSQTGLVHAVKLAMAAQGELSIMHIDPDVPRAGFEDFPQVRPLLERWGLLPHGSPREQVADLGIAIKKTRTVAKNRTEAILQYLAKHPADLLVMATNQHEGLARWQYEGVAEPVARGSQMATLFVPTQVEGFVVKDSGQPKLRRVLVPVSAEYSPQLAIDTTAQLASALGCDNLTVIVVQVGDDRTLHSLRYPIKTGWLWHTMACQGNVVEVILAMGKDFDVDLIVMTTSKQHTLLDLMRGSVTERVLRGARCPLLALPV